MLFKLEKYSIFLKDLLPSFPKADTYTETRYVVYDTISSMYVTDIDFMHPYDLSKDVENDIYKSKTVVTTFSKKSKADALACYCNLSSHGTRYVVHELIVTVNRKENYNQVNTKQKNNIKKIAKEYFAYFDQKPHDSMDGILTLFSLPDCQKYKYLMLIEVPSDELKTLKSEAARYLNYKNNKRIGVNNKQKKSLYGFYVNDVASVVNFKLLSSCNIEIKLFDLKSSKFVELLNDR